MIITKNNSDLKEYSICHPVLLELLFYVDDFVYTNFGKNICVTEVYRTDEEQNKLYPDNLKKVSLHMLTPVQAIDIRSWEFNEKEVEALNIAINDGWDFGFKNMQCCIFHKLKSGAYHFHIQACDATKRRWVN